MSDEIKPMRTSYFRTVWRKLFWKNASKVKPNPLDWVLLMVDYEDGSEPAIWFGVWTGILYRGFAAEQFFVPFQDYYALMLARITEEQIPAINGEVIRWQHLQLTM